MSNLEMIQKLSLGVEDTQKVTIEYEDKEYDFTLRPLSSGELSKLQVLEKKTVKLKVGINQGKRQKLTTNVNDVDVSSGDLIESQNETMFEAVALSLSIGEEKITREDVKNMKPGLPMILFEEVIKISNLSQGDLTIIKSFHKD